MANKRLNAVITIGGAVASSLRGAFGAATAETQKLGSAIGKLSRQQKLLSESIQTFGRQGKDVDGLRAKYASVTQELERQRLKLKQINAIQSNMGAAKSKMATTSMQLGVMAAAASTAFVPVVQAASFETAMLGIVKQVNGAKDANGQLTQTYYDMRKEVQLLGRELPIPTNEIAAMVASAARMDIAKEDLIDFTRTAAVMATAFELPAAQLAEDMGKISKIFKLPIKQVSDLGDAINYLDDNAISKGSDIIKVLQGDLAGAASTMGMSAKNAAALASTFLTLGESAERADTAASGMLRQLQIAKMNPKKFQIGVQMLGMTGDQLQKGMINDAQGTILKVLDAIKKLPQEKQMEAVTRLFGKDWGGAIAKLAGGVDEYRRQIELANGAAAKGSMSREFQSRMQTTNAQWDLMKNTLTELSVNIGTVMLPAVNSVLKAVAPVVASMSEWVTNNQQLVGNIAAVAGTLVGFAAGFKVVSLGITAAVWAFNALKLAMATNPLGLALVLLATAAVMIYKNWEPIKAFFISMWDGIKATFSSVYDWIVGKVATLFEITGKVKNAVTGIFGGGGGGDVQYDAMGNSTGAGALPAVPAAASRSGTTVQDNSTNTYHITQQPGQDAKSFAEDIERRRKMQAGVARRSSLVDGVGAQ